MPSISPDINKLIADKSEKELIEALDCHDDPDIPLKAAEALAGIGSIEALEPLCSLMENPELSTEVRIKTATAIGDICARLLKIFDKIDTSSLSDDELRKHQEEDQVLSWAGSRLKLSMKSGPAKLRKAAGNAYMFLPLEDDSDIMKAFSGGSTVSFRTKSAATDTFAQSLKKLDSPSPESLEEVQNISVDPKDQTDDINEKTEAEPEPEPEAEPEVKPDPQTEIEDIETSTLHLDEPVEIAPNTYWIGRREGSFLERNIYLRIFSDGKKTINLLIDPGPPEDLTSVIEKLSAKIGGPDNLHLMFLNHQDPDVSYNAGHLQKLNPDCVVLCSKDSWSLVSFYGLNQDKCRAIEQFNDLTVELSTGHQLRFLPSPYCHFRGAVMLYDEETDVLFTGDFLAGLSFKPDLFATEDSWDGISTFHQIYMPSQKAIRNAVNNIRNLDPLPGIIAPQHGSIISGGLVNDFLGRIDYLEVGIDLFLKEHSKESYIEVMNELLSEFLKLAGSEIMTEILHTFLEDSSLPNMISFGANGIHDIKINPYHAIRILLRELQSKTPPEIWKTAEIEFLKVLTIRKINIPECMMLNDSDEMVFHLTDRFKSGKPANSI